MRLIDADRIVAVAKHAFNEWNLAMATQETNRGVNRVFKMQELCKAVRAVADDCPAIDPESLRPHGRWVCVNPAYGRYECSVCHAADEDCSDYYAAHNVTAQDFCPYCGAKMDGGETDEAK